MINIKGIDKAKLLQALFNASKQQGLGFLALEGRDPMNMATAKRIMDECEKTNNFYFDYVGGRVMKVDLSGDELDPRLYDRDNGEGAVKAVVMSLRS